MNPASVWFSGGFMDYGTCEYDDAAVDPDASYQTVTLTGLQFQVGGAHYTADSDPTAVFMYGSFQTVSFEASTNYPTMPHLSIDMDGTVATVLNGNTGQSETVNINLVASPTINFANNTPGPHIVNGNPVAGEVQVDAKWLNAPAGVGNNKIKFEIIDAATGNVNPTQIISGLGAAGTNTQIFSLTTGKQIKVRITLMDVNNTVLDTKTSGVYTVP